MNSLQYQANCTDVTADQDDREVVLQGRSIAPGIGFGFAWVEEAPRNVAKVRVSESAVESERKRLHDALRAARKDLQRRIQNSRSRRDDRVKQILEVHEMMMNDPLTVERIESRISDELVTAEWAVSEEEANLVSRLEDVVDPYLQARAEDIRDVGSSILTTLSEANDGHASEAKIAERSGAQAMLTQHLFPTLAIRAHGAGVTGFATESPAVVSHAAIILKGLGIPVVGDVGNLISVARQGDEIIVDGERGSVVVRPGNETRKKYRRLARDLESETHLEDHAAVPAYTANGVRIGLMANIEHPSQMPYLLRKNLEGVGLFRTEFLILEHGTVPSEHEQFRVYTELMRSARDTPVVIRTFDIGADKNTADLHRCTGMNPALGVRGIRRHLLRDPDELRNQIRAVLRASLNARTAILFPMITNLNDIRKAKEQVLLAEAELRREGIPYCNNVRVGAMIEVPSAAILTTEILGEVDFVSIGTNDLLQYFTGADRNNPEVLAYQDPKGSAFRWLLEFVITKARELDRQKDVTVCGEIASDPEMVPILLEMGFRSLSISPARAEITRTCISNASVTTNQE